MSSGSVTENINTHSLGNLISVKDDKLRKKNKKKNRKRKRSDPLVTNISHLLSKSLSLVSPETNVIKNQAKLPSPPENSINFVLQHEKIHIESRYVNSTDMEEVVDLNDSKLVSNGTSKTQVIISDSETSYGDDMKIQSKNAFEFMMESRNKSIGRNSPGKEMDKDTNNTVTPDNKDKLIARKLLFEKWATAKGSKKYKVDEKEREIYIKQQLQKRAKKFKKLLSIDENPKYKKTTTLISDSDDSKDIYQAKSNVKEILKTIDTTLNANDKNVCDDQESKCSTTEHKNSLHKFLNITKPEKRKFMEDDSFESDENENSNREDLIKFKMFSPTVFKRTKKTNKNHTSFSKCYNENEHSSNETRASNAFAKLNSNNKIRNIKKKDKHHSNSEKLRNSTNCSKASTSNGKMKLENLKLTNTKMKATDANVYINESDFEDNQNKSMNKNITRKFKKHEKMQSDLKKSKNCKILEEQKSTECKTKANYSLVQDKSVKHPKKITSSRFLDIEEGSSSDSVCIIENSAENNENNTLRRSLRSRKTKTNYNDLIDVYLVSSEDSEDVKCKKNDSKADKPIKIAPVFLQNKIKPKIDPLVLEARRKFLMSGIPEALQKSKEKQQSLEDIETNVFPEISHVQQKCTTENGMDYWNLPKVNLPVVKLKIPLPEIKPLGKGVFNKFDEEGIQKNFEDNGNGKVVLCSPEKIKNLKLILLEIKKNNPHYPVFKSFRLLKEKFDRIKPKEAQEKLNTSTKKKKRRNKKESKSDINKQEETNYDPSMMWSEKYKASTHEDLIGNYSSTSELRRWLQGWLDVSENKSKILRRRDSSGSEFDNDNESRDSSSYPRNAIVLIGPHGSGKTMAVYALCNELGINVLELNASSKRTGKRLMQEMQEATQSHQVRKNETLALDTIFKSTGSKANETTKRTNDPPLKTAKMCLLLVEDVDIVFEQDDGFLTALTQLLTTSKRPIVMTATGISSPTLQKVIGQNSVIQFSPLKPKVIAVWMQIVCLLEGCFISNESLCELLEWNKGDVRKMLLQLQFWVESGGGNYMETPLNIISNLNTSSGASLLNDDTHLSFEEIHENDPITVRVHSNCVSSFLDENAITLEKIWWNLPQYSNINADIRDSNANASLEGSTTRTIMADLQKFYNYFESISEIDRCHIKSGIVEDNCLTSKNALLDLKDSTELSEVYCDFNTRIDFVKEWSNSLLCGHMKICENSEKIVLDMGLPNSDDRRWENKQLKYKEKYKEMVPLSYHVDRRAFNLDYFPCLRTITRSEVERSANNQKRRNRFFNYLRNLGFSCSETVLKTACNVLDHNFNDCKRS